MKALVLEEDAEGGRLLHPADEVVGILVVVARNNEQLLCVLSQLLSYAQALWLNPPSRGSRIITTILCNPTLQEEW